MFFSSFILAISLSLDALGVGIVYGFRRVKIPLASKLIICFFSIVYSGLAIITGKSLSSFIPRFAKLSGVMILILMGIWIITQALFKNEGDSGGNGLDSGGNSSRTAGKSLNTTGQNDLNYPKSTLGTVIPGCNQKISRCTPGTFEREVRTLCKIAIKSLGITIHIFRDPLEFDMDHSGIISTSESFLLGLALSVDAIGAGIGSGLMGFDSWLIPLAVGVFQIFFLYAGNFLGRKWAAVFRINEKLLAVLPGTLLIVLAVLRIF